MHSRDSSPIPSSSRALRGKGRVRPAVDVEVLVPPPPTLETINQPAPTSNTDGQALLIVLQQIKDRLSTLEQQSTTPTTQVSNTTALEDQSTTHATTHTAELPPADWMSRLNQNPSRHALPPSPHADISKFKPDATFNGFGSLESFLFSLRQSIAAYNLQSEPQKLLALGRSLKGEALDWWAHNAPLFSTINEAIDGMFRQYDDLTKPGDCLRRLNRLTQTGSTRLYFRRAEKLNLHAKLNEDALWKTLKEGLKVSLRTALATVRPAPTTYTEWKQVTLELGAELDAIITNESGYRQRALRDNDKERDESKNQAGKNLRKERFTNGCFGCGNAGHQISDCPNKNKPDQHQPVTSDAKKRRQGDPHYPPSKKPYTGTVRVTELNADADVDSTTANANTDNDSALKDTDHEHSDSDLDSVYDSGKD